MFENYVWMSVSELKVFECYLLESLNVRILFLLWNQQNVIFRYKNYLLLLLLILTIQLNMILSFKKINYKQFPLKILKYYNQHCQHYFYSLERDFGNLFWINCSIELSVSFWMCWNWVISLYTPGFLNVNL